MGRILGDDLGGRTGMFGSRVKAVTRGRSSRFARVALRHVTTRHASPDLPRLRLSEFGDDKEPFEKLIRSTTERIRVPISIQLRESSGCVANPAGEVWSREFCHAEMYGLELIQSRPINCDIQGRTWGGHELQARWIPQQERQLKESIISECTNDS